MKKIFLPLGLLALIAAPSAGLAKLVLDIPPILAGKPPVPCEDDTGCTSGKKCCSGSCYSETVSFCYEGNVYAKSNGFECGGTFYPTGVGYCCGGQHYATTDGFCCAEQHRTSGVCCDGDYYAGACPAPSGPTGRLNDTGISWSGGTATGNSTTCTDDNQDCNYGWDKDDGTDATNGHAGFKFTKLDSSGNVTTGTPFECVRDERTGLIWEVKTPSATTKTWEVAKTDATSFSACGKSSGWRLPTVKELLSIVSYYDVIQSPAIPAIDIAYFQNTASAGYWTSTEVADANTTVEAWIVNFSTAMTAPQGASLSKNVRLVHD